MRKIVLAVLLGTAGWPASAELRPEDEPLTRCQVVFDVAYQLIVPEPATGQSEEQAIATLPADMRHLASALHGWSQESTRRLVGKLYQTAADSKKLAAVEKDEEDAWVNRINGAKTEPAKNAVFDDLLNRANDCADKFFPES